MSMGWSFSAPWGSETSEPIHLKSGMFDYVHSTTSHAKYGGRQRWAGVGIWVKLYPRVLFSYFIYFFGSFNSSTAYPEKRGFSLSASKKCFGGGVKASLFTPEIHFQWAE